MKVKFNKEEYSRGEVICKADIHNLNRNLTQLGAETGDFFCFLLVHGHLLSLHHQIELDLLLLNPFGSQPFLLIYNRHRDLSQLINLLDDFT
jgi:hypothetical protein